MRNAGCAIGCTGTVRPSAASSTEDWTLILSRLVDATRVVGCVSIPWSAAVMRMIGRQARAVLDLYCYRRRGDDVHTQDGGEW